MEVRNSQFTAFIDTFTGNTYIMVIMATAKDDEGNGSGGRFVKPKTSTALIQINITAARKHFEKFIPESSWEK